ncbi:hypothetical protein GEV33_009526 [Tenebrio molitor]|uniref:Uncharacterized protein n=1 Tax=Tenebrio molitor TaxID=7067 RepID=A0A8J6H795_TENMO|nr:hypothetical protein GEV33_009526 [Tenebrio molitor]
MQFGCLLGTHGCTFAGLCNSLPAPPAPRHLPAEIAARRPLPPRTPPPSPHHRIAPYAEGHMLLAGDLCNGDNYANGRSGPGGEEGARRAGRVGGKCKLREVPGRKCPAIPGEENRTHPASGTGLFHHDVSTTLSAAATARVHAATDCSRRDLG